MLALLHRITHFFAASSAALSSAICCGVILRRRRCRRPRAIDCSRMAAMWCSTSYLLTHE
jgi:hypothetical protein